MIYTLEDFIREYRKIKEMGWIRTHRAGPTGVGKTLEDLLGIEENNHDAPDFGEYELKSCRVNSQSMLTMFTKTPQPPKANTYLRLKYGYSSSVYDNEEKVLHSTLTAAHFVPIADTGHQLKIVCDAQKISIASELGTENVYWVWGDRIFEKCGIRRDEEGDGGKTLEIRGKRRLSARDGGANYQQS